MVNYYVKDLEYPVDLATSIGLENYRANIRLFDKLAELTLARNALFQGSLIVATEYLILQK